MLDNFKSSSDIESAFADMTPEEIRKLTKSINQTENHSAQAIETKKLLQNGTEFRTSKPQSNLNRLLAGTGISNNQVEIAGLPDSIENIEEQLFESKTMSPEIKENIFKYLDKKTKGFKHFRDLKKELQTLSDELG